MIAKLVTPSILLTANVRSFADYYQENGYEDQQLNETIRTECLQKERETWEKYAKQMSPFYFGLLSHLMQTYVAKPEFDFEDVFILQQISKFFSRQELSDLDPKRREKVKNVYFIDGIISESHFRNFYTIGYTETLKLEQLVFDRAHD